MTTEPHLPLSRFSVLDLTRVRAGPTAVRQLADWGADVIKVEAPEHEGGDGGLGGPRHGSDFQSLHRNKRSMTLNLKHSEGVAILRRLAERADVLVENFRPDVKHRLGVDYDALSLVNPRLVYASISGFGQDGPYATRPGFDQIAQGMGGLMSVTGEPGRGPMRVGIPVADLSAGLYCALGILVALLDREVSGRGQWVQASLLQAQIAMMDFQAARWLMGKEVPGQVGNNHPTGVPTGAFRTSDGHVNIAATGDEIYRRFCSVMGREDWLTDPAFATAGARYRNRDEMNAQIEAITATRSTAGWVAQLNQAGVPCGPIYKMDQVFSDPQVRHLEMAAPMEHPTLGPVEVVAQGVALSRTPFAVRRPTPEPGEHTNEILEALGYDPGAIQTLRTNGVI